MKKICLLLAVCLMLGSFAGCAGETEETTVPTTAATTEAVTEATTEATQTTEPETTETTAPAETEPPIPQIIGYDVALPEEFEAGEVTDERMLYLSPDAPEDGSYILVRVTPRDGTILEVDEEGFQEWNIVEREYGEINLELTEINEVPALHAEYTVIEENEDEEEIEVHISEYHVVGDENYLFRCADETEEQAWQEQFAAMLDSIQILVEDQSIQLDYSGLELYDLGCGMSLYAVPGMEPQEAPGFVACLGNRNALILVMQDDKESNALTGLTLEEYAQLVSDSNDLDEFTLDNYGSLHTSFFSTDEQGLSYYNVLTVKETGDSFWVFQMTCTANDQADYDREFALWATSIKAN